MKKTSEMLRFEKDIASDAALRTKLDAAVREAIDSGVCHSDGEALSRAARSLGYEINAAELERMGAETQELSLEEMASAAGGDGDYDRVHKNLCTKDWHCDIFWNSAAEDEYGHNNWCATVWHCYMASMHTETESKNVSCWSDYLCAFINN